MITILDGPLGTELNARGVKTDLPLWSAAAIDQAPEVIAAIHRDYAEAGAVVHTANTFRTRRRTVGKRWDSLARTAVDLAKGAVPASHRVAGSIAPLEDCYRPDLSPMNGRDEHLCRGERQCRDEHRELAEVLADAGCDILLCETFPHVGEAIVAVEEAVRTGVETWLALTAGPNADLLTCAEMVRAAKMAIAMGASAVLVNCTPAGESLDFVRSLTEACPATRVGVYANAGRADDKIGWVADSAESAERYASLAKSWIDAGATLVGGCCGTRPSHIAAVAKGVNRIDSSR